MLIANNNNKRSHNIGESFVKPRIMEAADDGGGGGGGAKNG